MKIDFWVSIGHPKINLHPPVHPGLDGLMRMMQVDVSIQDVFFADDEGQVLGESPVSAAQWEHWFQCWLNQLQPDLAAPQGYELSLRLTTDDEIQRLNADYRHLDRPTDVLAFAALEGAYPMPEEMADSLPLYLGDIVISVETAQVQAQERGHQLPEELAWLAAHGLLHLLGWDHPDEESLLKMLQQQAALLQRVGFSLRYDDA